MSIRREYDEELQQVDSALYEMGAAAVQAIEKAVRLLEKPDEALARQLIEGDKAIDEKERQIEHACLELLLRQQPVARDLRRVSTALKLVTDVERIGDHAADIAEISEMLAPDWMNRIPVREDLTRMSAEAVAMVQDAVASFVSVDTEKAGDVIRRDDVVDGLFDRIKRELAAYIGRNPDEVDAALDLLMIIKYLERLGDHAVNVAEWVLFLKTGFYRGEPIV